MGSRFKPSLTKSKFSPSALIVIILALVVLGLVVASSFAATSKYRPDPTPARCPRALGIAAAGWDWQNEVSPSGVATIYGPNKSRTGLIQLCKVWGFRINRSIATNLNNMILAASKQGVALKPVSKYSGWRSYNMQRELRAANGCPRCNPPTALPGTSNHERGEALDFANASTRNTKVFIWLSKNAARYGFYNLPSESWHWSRNGR